MNIEELKKEAEEKAGVYFDSLDIDHGNVSDAPFSAYDIVTAYEKGALDFAEPREKRIAELEEANKTLVTMNNNMWVELEKKRAESQGITNRLHQLIEAKEIIKQLMRAIPYGSGKLVTKSYDRAEQFLQENE